MTAPGVSPPTLDLRSLPGPGRLEAVFAAFDALHPGEALQVQSQEPLDPLLDRLQAARPGRFEWSLLDCGPEGQRFEILRRDTASEHRGIAEALEADHSRLDALEKDAFEARQGGDFPRAAYLFRIFATGLIRHIGFEEHLLFPEFEARSGLREGQGPTTVMRSEHREIESLLEQVGSRIEDPGAEGRLGTARQGLHHVLREHNLKEEAVLYPALDSLLTEAERDDLVRRVQAYPG